MTKLRTSSLIHIFALLHFGTAVLCKSVGMSDTLLLTLLTMTLSVLICLRERLTLEFTAAAIVLVNIVGYFAGVGLAWVFNLFTTSSILQSGLGAAVRRTLQARFAGERQQCNSPGQTARDTGNRHCHSVYSPRPAGPLLLRRGFEG